MSSNFLKVPFENPLLVLNLDSKTNTSNLSPCSQITEYVHISFTQCNFEGRMIVIYWCYCSLVNWMVVLWLHIDIIRKEERNRVQWMTSSLATLNQFWKKEKPKNPTKIRSHQTQHLEHNEKRRNSHKLLCFRIPKCVFL